MSEALYRRYRPETFAEVIGQEHVTGPLVQALSADRITHAYLFSGPRGCGKTTSARILARCLNCAQGPTPTPCGTCASCLELGRGGSGSLDVVEIDAASHNGVDDARDLRERAAFAPARDRFKVFILDEAHMVTPQGFNALLKIVEEPPPHVKFIFATTEPDKVIGTIRSRTHHYPFRLVAPDTLTPYLEELCAAEGVPVGAGVLPLVVRAGGGSVRDSLSVLDQLIAGADEGGLDYERSVALLGYTHAALLDDVVDAISARDGASAFRVVDRVISSGHEPRRFIEDLLERLRDLIVIAASGEAARAALRDLPADQLDRMRVQAGSLGPAELSRSADLVNTALTEMTGATSPRLHLELLVARLLLPARDDGGVVARLERVERAVEHGAPAPHPSGGPAPGARTEPGGAEGAGTPQPQPDAGRAEAEPRVRTGPRAESEARAEPVPPARPEPPGRPARTPEPAAAEARPAEPDQAAAPEPTAQAGPASRPADRPAGVAAPEAETIRRRWPEVLQTLRGLRMATWVLVSENAQVAAVEPGVVRLAFSTPQLATTFRTGAHADPVRRALHETLGFEARVEPVLANDAGPASPGPARRGPAAPGSAANTEDRPARGMSREQAEASWSAAPSSRGAATSAPPASAPPGPAAGAGRSAGVGAADRPGRSPAAGPRRETPAASDGVPDGPEPDPEPEPPAEPPPARSEARQTPPARPVRPATGAPPRQGARPSTPSRPAPEDGSDASPDDPELAGSGLVGAPLIAQMLGGTVIDEIPDEPVT
ncbi:DNA polymerase III subunit gamma and tau [Isoptericola sp. b490]|uniref:DNA polymerase III subunit gamma and tau n=1 Tax=Actinotalea lenta TaxID=3064654 RepID=UPI002712B3E9|nr:DNA polymerase III subunit gamma and tau [Isoptericola sp. b490]MDO8121879.1 DNA polymerase III subunit gamma and tau [Isoptericola sp. b490]